jgi:hypothetical protein
MRQTTQVFYLATRSRRLARDDGPNYHHATSWTCNRRSTEHADKILRGTKPPANPVEHPTGFDLIVNLTIAKAPGRRRRFRVPTLVSNKQSRVAKINCRRGPLRVKSCPRPYASSDSLSMADIARHATARACTRIARASDVGAAAQTRRSTISFLSSAMALAGLRPLGQALVQFRIVWQR